MKLKPGWVTILALVVVAPAMAARTGSISGTVRDSAGVPQMGAMIQVTSLAPAASFVLYTDVRGHFSARNLVPGKYQVKASEASFLPTLRQDLALRAGADLVVNLTLNTLFEALQIMPVRARTADDQDDWKWTLRSMANRPILRIMDGDPLVVVSSSGNSDHSLKARLEFVSGSSADGVGSGSGQAAAFAMESSIFTAGTLQFDGAMGHNLDAPAVVRLAYAHQLSNGDRPQIAVTARRFYLQSPVDNRAALDALGVQFSNQSTIADFASIDYGAEYQTIQFQGRAAAFRPFATFDVRLSPNTVFEYRYATSRPTMRLEKGFDSAPADLSESDPRLSMTGFSPLLESAHHQEISVSHRIGSNSFQLAGYEDRIRKLSLAGAGDDAADDKSGWILADPYSETFTFAGGNMSTGGVRAVAEHKFSQDLKLTLDVAYGGVLDLASATPEIGQVMPEFAHVRQASFAAKMSGKISKTKTSWLASYKYNTGNRVLTSVDAFNASAGEADPFLNLFIRQPLPSPGFLPGQMEALLDIRNLLAQGYVPVLGQDGHTLYLVQSARAVRGGLAFNF